MAWGDKENISVKKRINSRTEKQSVADTDNNELRYNSNMEARAEHQRAKTFKALFTGTTALGVTLVILVLVWVLNYRGGLTWSSNPSKEFNWHPLLMITGLIFLYSQAILIYRIGRDSPKKSLKIAHGVLHCVAFIFSVIALCAVFDSHNLASPPIPNLYTLHSWIGLITVIIFSFQFLAGFVTFLFPGLSKSLRKVILPVHVSIGTLCFVMSIVTCVMGLTEKALWSIGDKYSQFSSEGLMVNFIGLITVFYGLLVLYLVIEIDYKRQPRPEDEMALSNQD